VAGTSSGSFFCPNFGQAGKELFQKLSVFKINFPNVSLTKITGHCGNTGLVAHEYIKYCYVFVRSLKTLGF